ncbi:MAG: amidohydrolase [Chloroflexota bacterium]|nr:amidohydrolase [Chloroflexota bacterium]
MNSIVDAHVHLFPPEVAASRGSYLARDRWFAELYSNPKARTAVADELLASMDANGIERSIVAAFPWADEELCEQHNAYYRSLGHRDRLTFLCTVQPRAGIRALDELRRCLDDGFAGMGEMNADAQGVELAEAEALQALAGALAEAGAAFMVHCSEPVGHSYPGKGANTPDKLYRFATSYPELVVVGAHWGGGLPFYYLMPEVGPSLPNLYFDSAAVDFLYKREIFPTAAGLLGPERMLFGSDFPLLSQQRALSYARSAGLSEDTERAFLGGNAALVYRFPLNKPSP